MQAIRQTGGTPKSELPELGSGVQLLDVASEERATEPLHSLVLDRLLPNAGTSMWVDAGGHAVVQSLASLAPSPRTLDRIRVARGFRPHQHYELVSERPERVAEETALVVCPAFETLVGPAEDGTGQTTLAFWKRVLKARATADRTATAPTPEVTVDGSH